jgi:hypothetical protein
MDYLPLILPISIINIILGLILCLGSSEQFRAGLLVLGIAAVCLAVRFLCLRNRQ